MGAHVLLKLFCDALLIRKTGTFARASRQSFTFFELSHVIGLFNEVLNYFSA